MYIHINFWLKNNAIISVNANALCYIEYDR